MTRKVLTLSNASASPLRAPLMVGLLVGLVASIAVGSARLSSAATTANFTLIGWAGGDQFYNYDNLTTTAAGNNVDWPVTMTFVNNAWVGGVKGVLDHGGFNPDFKLAGNTMRLRLKDNASLVWDSDNGIKDPSGSCPVNIHMRIYADPADDENWNPVDGFWLVGTTHWDNRENCAGQNFGWSEDASEQFANKYSAVGWQVLHDQDPTWNAEGWRVEGDHMWSNDGWAERVTVP